MNELRIVRGTDVRLYAEYAPLFGVTEFSAAQKESTYDVYEYLSAAPCERVRQGSRYEIRLEFMALFDEQLPRQDAFTLRFENGNTEYRYENCRVKERKTMLKGNQKAIEVFVLEADSMRKAVIHDE